MKVLFLYTELASYFISCLDALSSHDVEVHLVYYPINQEAPFEIIISDKIKRYAKNEFSNQQIIELANSISPDVIYSSGWTDKTYLKICKTFRLKCPIILGFDNKWRGSLKQRVASLFNKQLIRKYFSHCWIPGFPQLSYARRLGFLDVEILNSLYSCDFNYFHDLYLSERSKKQTRFPHRFIFVGRYYDFKGIEDLWNAFVALQTEETSDWELWCLGTGSIEAFNHPNIKHFGFVQPSEVKKIISETGVFVLPSRKEPWGVSVHEFAAAGFPLICSNEVGAANLFLEEDKNGYLFSAGNISELADTLKRIVSLSDIQLFKMGEKSVELAKQITPEIWSEKLLSITSEIKSSIHVG